MAGVVESLALRVLPQTFAICRMPAEAELPAWALAGGWASITRTAAELSIVCEASRVPGEVRKVGPWRAMEVQGPLDFSLTGIMAVLAGALAGAGISLFAVSTFDTDYILVKAETLEDAVHVLRNAGHKF
jgi:uncharacterized protein